MDSSGGAAVKGSPPSHVLGLNWDRSPPLPPSPPLEQESSLEFREIELRVGFFYNLSTYTRYVVINLHSYRVDIFTEETSDRLSLRPRTAAPTVCTPSSSNTAHSHSVKFTLLPPNVPILSLYADHIPIHYFSGPRNTPKDTQRDFVRSFRREGEMHWKIRLSIVPCRRLH